MPRIDPLDLLKCLGVLLSPSGGIKGPNEVVRIARLMLRFSKKLVSKCIYIHVLRATPSDLLDSFLNQNGWFLLQTWLTDALQSHNTPLLIEMLELLQHCPITDSRLKDNNVAQMIQSIAQDYSDPSCRNLATQLWTRWFVPKTSNTDEYSLSQESVLPVPEDMDLSIYAPDATTTTSTGDMFNYNESMNINLNSDIGVGMTMGALSTLDIQSYAPYMENTDFYNMSNSESISVNNNVLNNSITHDNYMANTYSNQGLQQQPQATQQSLLNSVSVQPDNEPQNPASWSGDMMQNSILATPPINNDPSGVIPATTCTSTVPGTAALTAAVAVTTTTTIAISPTPTAAATTTSITPTKVAENTVGSAGLPVLKIVTKGGRPYVVNSSQNEVKDDTATVTDQGESKDKQKEKSDKEKGKEKLKEKRKDKEKDKKVGSSGSKAKVNNKESTKDDGKKSDAKKKDKEKDKSKLKDKAKPKEKVKPKGKDDKTEKKVKSPKVEVPTKEAKQAEKDRETLAALKALTSPGVAVVKLAKIPRKKLEGSKTNEPSSSPTTTVTSADDVLERLQRPKTVKTFNSKFRSTGLVEEPVKTGAATKKAGASPLADKKSSLTGLKRTIPLDTATSPTEKKPKTIDDSAISAAVAAVMKKTANDSKPAVKLISPRPRPVLQDSSLFMDALEAGSKYEPRKRKRRTSTSKDGGSTPEQNTGVKQEPGESPSSNTAPLSPGAVKPMFKFYQDTLETDDREDQNSKEESVVKEEKGESSPSEESKEESEVSERLDATGIVKTEDEIKEDSERDSRDQGESSQSGSVTSENGKPKGVLVIHSQTKKRVKKSVQWKAEEDLEMHHYFELDETERVNVNKLQFGDMKQAERERERQAFQLSKHLADEEFEDKLWKGLIPIDLPPPMLVPGMNSREKEIQAARESSTLQALYFKGEMLPDSPAEPDPEVPLERTERLVIPPIPLDDVTGNPESVYDHRHLPWPEPKSQMYSGSYGQAPYKAPGPVLLETPYPERPMHGHHGSDMPHQPLQSHQGPNMPMGGHTGMRGGEGTWLAGDGSVYSDPDISRYGGGGPPLRNAGHGYNDMMGPNQGPVPPSGPGYMPPSRIVGMDGPRPRFHGSSSRSGSRSSGGGGSRGSSQPCWHFMRGFCRLENRCKFLHPGYSGPPMP